MELFQRQEEAKKKIDEKNKREQEKKLWLTHTRIHLPHALNIFSDFRVRWSSVREQVEVRFETIFWSIEEAKAGACPGNFQQHIYKCRHHCLHNAMWSRPNG